MEKSRPLSDESEERCPCCGSKDIQRIRALERELAEAQKAFDIESDAYQIQKMCIEILKAKVAALESKLTGGEGD